MLIFEYPTTEALEVRRHAIACAADAEAFVRDDGRGSLVVCGSDEAKAPGTPVERRMELLFTGGRYGSAGGDWLLYVGLWTPQEFRNEFLGWYRHEHLPILLENPFWDGCRFVEQKVGEGCQFYAMHQLSEKGAHDSTERKRSRSTAWFKRLSVHPWFDGAFTRTLCKRVQ